MNVFKYSILLISVTLINFSYAQENDELYMNAAGDYLHIQNNYAEYRINRRVGGGTLNYNNGMIILNKDRYYTGGTRSFYCKNEHKNKKDTSKFIYITLYDTEGNKILDTDNFSARLYSKGCLSYYRQHTIDDFDFNKTIDGRFYQEIYCLPKDSTFFIHISEFYNDYDEINIKTKEINGVNLNVYLFKIKEDTVFYTPYVGCYYHKKPELFYAPSSSSPQTYITNTTGGNIQLKDKQNNSIFEKIFGKKNKKTCAPKMELTDITLKKLDSQTANKLKDSLPFIPMYDYDANLLNRSNLKALSSIDKNNDENDYWLYWLKFSLHKTDQDSLIKYNKIKIQPFTLQSIESFYDFLGYDYKPIGQTIGLLSHYKKSNDFKNVIGIKPECNLTDDCCVFPKALLTGTIFTIEKLKDRKRGFRIVTSLPDNRVITNKNYDKLKPVFFQLTEKQYEIKTN